MLHFYSPLSLPLRRWIPFLYTVWLGSIDIGHSNTGVKYRVPNCHPSQTPRYHGRHCLVEAVLESPTVLPSCLFACPVSKSSGQFQTLAGWLDGEKQKMKVRMGRERGCFIHHLLVPILEYSYSRHFITTANIFNKTRHYLKVFK